MQNQVYGSNRAGLDKSGPDRASFPFDLQVAAWSVLTTRFLWNFTLLTSPNIFQDIELVIMLPGPYLLGFDLSTRSYNGSLDVNSFFFSFLFFA